MTVSLAWPPQLPGAVTLLDQTGEGFTVRTTCGEVFETRQIILATGMSVAAARSRSVTLMFDVVRTPSVLGAAGLS